MYDELAKRLREDAEDGYLIYTRIGDDIAKAADAIEELSKPKWISVEERLPEEDTDVLVVRKFLGVKGQVPPSTYVEIASRIGDDWCAASDEYKIARSKHTDPLFWMPLPEPPKEE